MSKAFHLYSWLAPAALLPLAAWGWWVHYDGNVHLVAVALAVPVIHAYVVPAIGANVLGVWQINASHKIGRIRPQHGFVFGSATALLTLVIVGAPVPVLDAGTVIETALWCGGVLLAVNWIYDALAIRAGYLEVFNQPWAEGRGPWAISADYVVWFFGLFGLLYGGILRFAEAQLMTSPDWPTAIMIAGGGAAITSVLPSIAYCGTTWLRYGHAGLRPCSRQLITGEDQWSRG